MKYLLLLGGIISATALQSQEICTDPNPLYNKNEERPNMVNKFDWKSRYLTFWNNKEPFKSYNNLPAQSFNPFYTEHAYLSHINFYNLPDDQHTTERLDFYPKDGWELLHKNDGFARNQRDRDSLDYQRQAPYWILYNKYRGLIRVIGGATTEMLGFQKVLINISRKRKHSDVFIVDGQFNKSNSVIKPLDQNTNILNISQGVDSPSYGKFYSADFNISYDPCICNVYNSFMISFQSYSAMNVNLQGRIIGTNIPIDGMGNGGTLNSRNFLSEVYNDGFNINGGALTYKNIEDLVAKYKVVEETQEEENMYAAMFLNAARDGVKGLGTGGDDALKDKGKALWGKYIGGRDILTVRDKRRIGDEQFRSVLKFGQEFPFSISVISSAANMLSTVLFPEAEKPQRPAIPSISFLEAEVALTGTVTLKTPINGTEIEFSIPGSKYTSTDTLKVPNNKYPLYNKPLGLFALLETPRGVVEYRKTALNTDFTLLSYMNKNPSTPPLLPFKYAKEQLLFKLDKNSIKYTFNNAADIDLTKTKIYATFEIKELTGCLQREHLVRTFDAAYLWRTDNWQLIRDGISIPADKNSLVTLNDDCTELVTYFSSMMPLECLVNTGQVLEAINPIGYNSSSENQPLCVGYDEYGNITYQQECNYVPTTPAFNLFLNTKQAYLKLHIEYAFKTNQYGKENTFFEILTYPVTLTDGTVNDNLVPISSNYSNNVNLPQDIAKITEGGTNYSWDHVTYSGVVNFTNRTTIYAGTEQEILEGGEVSGEVEMGIDDSFLCGAKIPPVDQNYITNFCATKYFGKQWQNNYRRSDSYENEAIASNTSNSEFVFELYPNPASHYVNVHYTAPDKGAGQISIKDLAGRTVYKSNENTNQLSIDVSSLGAGLYFCQLEIGTKKYSQKLVIVK